MSINAELSRIALNGATMGTRYYCIFYAQNPDDYLGLAEKLHTEISYVDQVMSNWKPDSDLNIFNKAPLHQWVTLPKSLMHVLETAFAIEKASQGAFNIGVAQQVAAWGFGPQALPEEPIFSENQVLGASDAKIEWDRQNLRLRKMQPVTLDLSGIAKGYGVDRLGETLSQAGITNWLVGIDGEMRARGTKPDGSPWNIGHERPIIGERQIMGVIELSDLAVATSGTYRHCHRRAGRMVSHTIDPKTNAPISGPLASVTVLAENCMIADAWATAILVDGHWPPRSFSTPANIEAILVPSTCPSSNDNRHADDLR